MLLSQTSLLVDAEAFGSPAGFTAFAGALEAAADWPMARRRVAVFTLGWATDANEAEWSSMGWDMIQAMPRPAFLGQLRAVRRMARQEGPLTVLPSKSFIPPR